MSAPKIGDYFSAAEMGCRHCGLVQFAPGFTTLLLALRLELNEPMNLNSACRCKAHNTSVGGHPRSLHVADDPSHATGGCCAVDVGTRDGAYRARLIGAALGLGWSVGVNATFVHLDRGADYGARLEPQVFLY
jgi:hypothetical protein